MVMKDDKSRDKIISDSLNEYYDAKDDSEDRNEMMEEFYPVQSITIIENEWISPEEVKKMKPHVVDDESPYFANAKIDFEERVRFISPLQQPIQQQSPKASPQTSPKINRSILDELLPTQIQLETSNENNDNFPDSNWRMNDKICGQVFKGCFVIWLLASFYLISTKPAPTGVPTDKLTEITGWFACSLVLGLALTAVWAKILAEQTEVIVYGLMMAVPAGFALLTLFAFSHFYILSGLICLIISAILSIVIYFNRKTLKTTAEIVHSAAIFIQATPKVYALVMKIVAGYVVIVFIWLKAYTRLFNSSSNWSIIFVSQLAFIFMLLWIGAVLSTVQKFLIATWVRAWMDKTDDSKNKKEAKILDEKSFGTICLAAGLLSLANMTRIARKGTEMTMKALGKFVPGHGIISQFFTWISALISATERFMQRFTDFVVYYLAVSDCEGFIDSCRGLSNAIDGNLALAVTTDTTAQLLLTFSTVLIGFASTTLILIIAKNRTSYYSGMLIGLLSASVMDFVSNTYTSAIDASFLCYVMDLKRPNRTIDKEIHEAFSSKLSSV